MCSDEVRWEDYTLRNEHITSTCYISYSHILFLLFFNNHCDIIIHNHCINIGLYCYMTGCYVFVDVAMTKKMKDKSVMFIIKFGHDRQQSCNNISAFSTVIDGRHASGTCQKKICVKCAECGADHSASNGWWSR